MKTLTRTLASLFLAAALSQAQSSLNFNLGGPGETIQDDFIFASGNVTATATAWSISRTAQNPVFQQSEIVQWSPGIGVKNATETITDVPYVPYYVDNEDHFDFVLFIFSEKVDLTQVKLHPSSGTFDLDASFWLGNIDPATNLTGDLLADLSSLGFGSRIDSDGTVSNSSRFIDVTTPVGGVNALLIGAKIGGDPDFDRFKISEIQGVTVIPEPSSAVMLLGALALAVRRRRR
jgi:hypothetical protein